MIIFIPESVGSGVGWKNIAIIIFANFEIFVVVTQLLLYLRRGSLKARYMVDTAYRCAGEVGVGVGGGRVLACGVVACGGC